MWNVEYFIFVQNMPASVSSFLWQNGLTLTLDLVNTYLRVDRIKVVQSEHIKTASLRKDPPGKKDNRSTGH